MRCRRAGSSAKLQPIRDGVGRADGNQKSFNTVAEEVLATRMIGTDYRTTAGQGLALHERETFFDGGQYHDVAALMRAARRS